LSKSFSKFKIQKIQRREVRRCRSYSTNHRVAVMSEVYPVEYVLWKRTTELTAESLESVKSAEVQQIVSADG
jgi:hypothetical protein